MRIRSLNILKQLAVTNRLIEYICLLKCLFLKLPQVKMYLPIFINKKTKNMCIVTFCSLALSQTCFALDWQQRSRDGHKEQRAREVKEKVATLLMYKKSA